MKKILFIFIGALILGQGLFGFSENAHAAFGVYSFETGIHSKKDLVADVANGTEAPVSVPTSGLGNSYMTVSQNGEGGAVGLEYEKKDGKEYLINYYRVDSKGGKAVEGDVEGIKMNPPLEKFSDEETKFINEKAQLKDPTNTKPPADRARAVEAELNTTPPEPCTISLLSGKVNLLGCAQVGANIMLTVSSYVLWLAGVIFNFTLGMSLNLASLITSMAIVNIGWTIFRDISNICFIFILLVIAIATILQIESYNVKKLLRNVILVALLLNFSLFFTKVVIDASNILALQFYAKISVDGKPVKGDGSAEDIANILANADSGISSAMIKGLGLESIYSSGQSAKVSDTAKATTDLTNVPGQVTFGNLLIIGVGGSILILMTAFVLLAGTILFIIRTVVLVFVMVLSPIAFLSLALPATSKYFADWRKALLNQAFFAPLYMIMIWIVFAAVNGTYTDPAGKAKNFAALLSGSKDSIGTIYTFVVLIGFMIASLVVAKQVGAKGADFAGKTAGGAMFGAGAWAGRQTIGRAAKVAQESAFVKNLASNKYVGFAGRGLERGLKRTTEASFDARNVKSLGDIAGKAGGKGGYAKSFDNKVKDLKDQQKRIGELSQGEQDRKDKLQADSKIGGTIKEKEERYRKYEKVINDAGGLSAANENDKLLYQQAQSTYFAAVENKKKLDELDKNAKARRENYLNQPDLVHGVTQFVTKKTGLNIVPGITTAQSAMVRSVRKEENESEEKKALKVLKKAWEKENKEKADSEPKEEPKEEKKK